MATRRESAEDITWIRRWIKKGLSKDKKTLDLSNRRFTLQIAIDVGENLAVPGVDTLYMHNCWIKDAYLEELVEGDLYASIQNLWMYENMIRSEGAQYLAPAALGPPAAS